MRAEDLDLKSDEELAAWVKSLVVNKTEESIWLDYKDGAALNLSTRKAKSDLAKDISAFANTQGGAVVYGVPEDKIEGATVPAGQYGMAAIPNVEETIGSVLADAIAPPLPSPRARKVRVSARKVVYVVWHPESWEAPHLVSAYGEKRYYKRHCDKQSIPVRMEEREIAELHERRHRGMSASEAILDEWSADFDRVGGRMMAIGACPLYARKNLLRFESPETRDWLRANRWRHGNLDREWFPSMTGIAAERPLSVAHPPLGGRKRYRPPVNWRVDMDRSGAVFWTTQMGPISHGGVNCLDPEEIVAMWNTLLAWMRTSYAHFGIVGPVRLLVRGRGMAGVRLQPPSFGGFSDPRDQLVFEDELLEIDEICDWSEILPDGDLANRRMTDRLLMAFRLWENPYFTPDGQRKDPK